MSSRSMFRLEPWRRAGAAAPDDQPAAVPLQSTLPAITIITVSQSDCLLHFQPCYVASPRFAMDDDDLSFNFSSRSVEENLWSNPAPSCALARAADKMTSEAGAPRKKERDMPTKHAREDKAKLPERTAVQAAAQSALPPKKEARVKAPRASDSIADDPNRYHAKPGALEGEAVLKRPLESSSTAVSAIFSRTPFAALPLNEKLVELLESPDKDRAGAVKISNADTKRGDVVNGLGLKTCTNVQGVIVPLLHKNRVNVLVKSQTGSGKTLAYLLPVLNDLMTQPRRLERAEGTRALIIAPPGSCAARLPMC